MSGIDEQGVPQCPKCNKSREFRVGKLTWMFPEDARVRRGLKYSVYTRYLVNGECTPDFNDATIMCIKCNIKYFNNHKMYKKLKRLFYQYIEDGKCYVDGIEFKADDRLTRGGMI